MCSQNTIKSGVSKARQVKYNKPKAMKTVSNGDFNRSFVLGAMPGCVAMSVLRENYMVRIRWSQQDLQHVRTPFSSYRDILVDVYMIRKEAVISVPLSTSQ